MIRSILPPAILLILFHLPATAVLAGEPQEEGDTPDEVEALFAPSRLSLEARDSKVDEILTKITGLTGNPIHREKGFRNVRLPLFEAEGTFWQAMDRLCEASGNTYLWIEPHG
jgi:hypothetical protein